MANDVSGGGRADVIIIGAGLSGLYAARTLSKAGLRPVVLEARDRVGGLTYSPFSQALGGRVDLGGQWVSEERHTRMAGLVREFGVPFIKQFTTGQRACLHGEQTFFGPAGTIPGLTEAEAAEYEEAIGILYAAMEGISADEPWRGAEAERLDSMTFASWIATVAHKERAKAYFTRLPGAYFGALAHEISALELLYKLKIGGGPLFMSDAATGGQSAHMMGSQIVSERLAAELGGAVQLNAPARRVVQDRDGITVVSDRGSWSADYLVCALSPALVSQIAFDPPLPAQRRLLHQRFPNGRNTKAAIIYERPFWRDRGLNGNVIATDGSLTAAYDLGDEVSEKGVLIALMTGAPAYRADVLPPEARRARVLQLLAQALGPEALAPAEYMDQVWADEAWSAGASSPFMLPGAMTTIGAALREPCGRIFWAGTHMATAFRGYMEGAVSAGEAAAQRIITGAGERAGEPAEFRRSGGATG